MRRAALQVLGDEPNIDVPIATAEDSIISKLESYRISDETPERQWDDVSRLIKLLGDGADFAYLETAAESVGVSDLLRRLREQL